MGTILRMRLSLNNTVHSQFKIMQKKTRRKARYMMAEWTGLEPATPGVTGRYSNQLNYHSNSWWVLQGSNLRPSPCKGDALPAELSTRKIMVLALPLSMTFQP
jgi:hypothetical protein